MMLAHLPLPSHAGQRVSPDMANDLANATVQLASDAMRLCGRHADDDDSLAVHALIVAAASVAGRAGSTNVVALLSQARLQLAADAPAPARIWSNDQPAK
jgi:hypothetical protein